MAVNPILSDPRLPAQTSERPAPTKARPAEMLEDFAVFVRQNFLLIQSRYKQLKQEHPIRLLAMIGASAFVAGAIYRLRRSSV